VKYLKLLICSTEYYPHGAGIANVVYNVVVQLKKQDIECIVCSPTGPDIKLGSQALIQKTGILGLLYYWYQVSRHFENNDYDAVWFHNPLIFTKNPFKICIVTMHSTYYGSSKQRMGNFLFNLYKSVCSYIERYCLIRMHSNTQFTGVSRQVGEELESIGIEKDRIFIISNGVDVELFHPSVEKKALRQEFGIPDDEIVILSVGRLTNAKKPLTTIEIFSHLEGKNENLTLCIVGNGELMESAQNLVKTKGLRKVIFLGHVKYQNLPNLYACSDYYIMTSKYEGGMPPLTLAEAMASGLPCIVSDIPQLEIVRVANCGIIVNFEDVEKASDIIYTYLAGIHQDHSKNARNCAINTLDWEIIVNYYINHFNNKKM
jgi:1,2-diacylglycerol 3-alpha-glucosyltransferase